MIRRGKKPWIPIATALRIGGGEHRLGCECIAPGAMFPEAGRIAFVTRERKVSFGGSEG